MIPSVTTIALSTIMPMAMINAPSEIRCRSMPMMAITMNEPRIGNTSPLMPMMIPARMPIVTASSASTITTDSSTLIIKAEIESLTWSDCQEIRSTPMPTGRSATSSASRRSIACPTRTTFSPEPGASAIAMACRPLWRKSWLGGSM